MTPTLPSDEEIRSMLVPVRERVMRATTEVRSPRRSSRYRATRNAIVAGVAGLALSAGAAVVVVSQQEAATTVDCYEAASLDSDRVKVAAPDPVAEDGHVSETAPVDPSVTCQVAWALGDLGRPDSVDPEQNRTFPVPPLVACVQRNGVGAAFPNRDDVPADRLCEALGLAVWDPDSGV